MDILKVTVDTSTLLEAKTARLEKAAEGLPIDFRPTTVTEREIEGTKFKTRSPSIVETGVWEESRWGEFVWGGTILESAMTEESKTHQSVTAPQTDAELLETLLLAASGGGFPKQGYRENLSKGNWHLVRDMMILVAHTRDRRDILVADDPKAFGKPGSPLRKKLEALCATRIMTVDEFCAHCDELHKSREGGLPVPS